VYGENKHIRERGREKERIRYEGREREREIERNQVFTQRFLL
jgi:hypothetical protein